jgi:2-polyprenyl-3-methyl-5-hydroxy-6-metoxy-1,4-benzoquinol methylase
VETYRSRIYGKYVQARDEPAAYSTRTNLASRAPYLRRLIGKHFPKSLEAAVLDLGCGNGALMHFAHHAGYRNLRGIDNSPEQITAARQLGIEGIEQANLVDAIKSQPSASLDVVIAFDVIEHFTREELLPFVDEVYRILKPEGRWIIHAPNGESPFAGTIRYGDLTHELAFTRMSLTQLLLASNFSSVAFYEDAPVVSGIKSALRWVLWKCIRGMLRTYVAVETGDTNRAQVFSRNLLAVALKRV